MKENNFIQKINPLEVDSREFHSVNKKIETKSGVEIFVVGAVSKTTGTWVQVREDNGEIRVKRLNEIVSASDPAWKKIEKLAQKSNSQRLENIRPPGRYSYIKKTEGNI